MPFAATWIDLEIIILSEVKSERERQTPSDITYMWNLKYDDTNELISKTERLTNLESRRMVTKGETWG